MNVYLDYQAAKPVDIRVISEITIYLNHDGGVTNGK